MKIGIIADIHANLPALEAVLDKIRVDKIFCLGDIVGYYPYVNEVFEIIYEKKIECILGNHDYAAITGDTTNMADIAVRSIKYTQSKITNKNKKFLEGLPKQMEFEINDKSVLLVHASPWNELYEYIYPDSPIDRFKDVAADIILMGHTHRPMMRKLGSKIIANPGACGQPRDGDPRTSYMVIDSRSEDIKINRVKYDVEEVYAETIRSGLDSILAQYLKNGGKNAKY